MESLINNWGLYPKNRCTILQISSYDEISYIIKNNNYLIARGNGRCYGDASLSKNIISTKALNKILYFDESNEIICCQSGVLLDDILKQVVPKGFFLPVTPGTKLITIGGALASDIHGKNHHVDGVISDHVISFKLINKYGEIINVTPNDELFAQTAGGMGSTGIIIEVIFRLKKIETSFIKQKSIRANNLKEIFQLFEEHKNYTYSVAWIDCLAKGKHVGKSVLLLGEHAKANEVTFKNKLSIHNKPFLNIPFNFPNWILNPIYIKIFNFLFYNKPSSSGEAILHYDPYFYPLDKINNWNRIYGKRGFIQYQFVLPIANSYDGVKEILGILSQHTLGSFLAVLKLFGKSHEDRYLHFPMEGYTLALDIKVSPTIWNVLDQLDEIVNKFSGKIYLTKDARMNKLSYEKQYSNRLPNTTKFFSHQMTRLSNTNNHCFLIIGANSDIAKSTAIKYLVKYPNGHLLLASRNINELNEFVQLNNIENQSTVIFYDITPTTNNKQFVDSLPNKPTWIMYAAGVLVENETAIQNQAIWENNAYVNYTGAVAILNELMNDNNPFLNRIIGITSIAGLRGRKSNYIYGSAKSGFHQYLSGLRQSLKSSNILVQAITPGFVKTKMTKNIPLNKLANSADQVAEAIISNSKSFEVYPNIFWWYISKIIKNLPDFIIAKL